MRRAEGNGGGRRTDGAWEAGGRRVPGRGAEGSRRSHERGRRWDGRRPGPPRKKETRPGREAEQRGEEHGSAKPIACNLDLTGRTSVVFLCKIWGSPTRSTEPAGRNSAPSCEPRANSQSFPESASGGEKSHPMRSGRCLRKPVPKCTAQLGSTEFHTLTGWPGQLIYQL